MFPFYSFLSNPIVFVFHQGHVYFSETREDYEGLSIQR